ncbi:MAG: GIY-YIG nuclease family protein [Rudanella sp.]|nr:GIY-YIG nuclease family protein [Rudanella sp.]
MSYQEIDHYLNNLRNELLVNGNWQRFFATKEELTNVPKRAGVYVFRNEEDKIVYVGETGSLYARMKNLFDTRNHNLRRSIVKKFYSDIEQFPNYVLASASDKFDKATEDRVNNHLCQELWLAFMEVPLGRKELELQLLKEVDTSCNLNIRAGHKQADHGQNA